MSDERPQDDRLQTVLETWPEKWRHADLWRYVAGGMDIDDEAVARAFLQCLSRPSEPVHVFSTLLSDGAFQAAEALLEHEPFREATADQWRDLEAELSHQRMLAEASVGAAIDDLLLRSRQARAAVAGDDPRFSEARACASRDMPRATQQLREVEEVVVEAEDSCIAELRQQLHHSAARFHSDPELEPWRHRIEAAFGRRDLELAESLLATTPSAASGRVRRQVPPPLEGGPYGRRDPADLCRWSLSSENAPPEFHANWNPLARDDRALALVTRLLQLCVGEVEESDVAGFVQEIEGFIGGAAGGQPLVAPFAGGFQTTLRGLEDEACPAFEATGVAFHVLSRNPAARAEIPSSSRPAIVFAIDADSDRQRNQAFLTPWDLFRCLRRPEDFRFNVLRIVAGQMPAEELMPLPGPPSNWMASSRGEVEELWERSERSPQLVVGAAGIGKTVLLKALVARAESEGWTTRYVEHPWEIPSPLSPASSPLFLTIDDGHAWKAEDLDRLLGQAASSPDRLRVVIAGLPPLWTKAPARLPADQSRYHLRLLPLHELRSFIERILDVSFYVPARPAVLDRMAYHCAGRPSLLYALMRAVMREADERGLRNSPVDLDCVQAAVYRPEYRDAARAILLRPVQTDPLVDLVFAAVLLEFDPDLPPRDAAVKLSEVVEWLQIEDVPVPEEQCAVALEQLRLMEVIDRDDVSSGFVLSRRGGGSTLLSLIGDRGDYFHAAKERFTTPA